MGSRISLMRPRSGILDGFSTMHHRAVVQLDLVDDAGRGGDQVLVELALQALLHDLHVQQAQEAAAEAEAQRLADLGLVVQRAVVELELLQRVAQLVVLAGLGRVQAGEHLRLDLLEAGQRLGGRAGVVRQLLLERDGVADLGGLQLLDAADDEAHLAGLEHLARHRLRREHAHLLDRVDGVAGHHAHALVLAAARRRPRAPASRRRRSCRTSCR